MTTKKQRIKAVTFDLLETLLFERDGFSMRRQSARCKNVAETLGKFGVEISVEQMESALKETISSLMKIWDTSRDITHQKQVRLLLKTALGDNAMLSGECVAEVSGSYVSPIFEVPPYVNPDARGVFEWLKSQNKRIGLICNTGLTPGFALQKLLAQEGVAEYFDLMIFSDEVGIRKPDPEIFYMAARKLRVEPCEAVHVGDNLRMDVWGAQNAGLRAFHLAGDEGRDKIAEKDPTSLVSLSRSLGNLNRDEIRPDKTVGSLALVVDAIREIEQDGS